MDRLAAMKVFVRVVETGSFSAIARENATTQSAVSKQVAALEATIGTKLLSRSTRALSLTVEGEKFLPEARRIVSDFEALESALRWGQRQLTGWLRVAASGRLRAADPDAEIQSFLELHPSLRIDLRLSDGFTDLIEQAIDVAVRVGDLPDSSFVARKIGRLRAPAGRAPILSRSFSGPRGRARKPRGPQGSQLHRLYRRRDPKRVGVSRRRQFGGPRAGFRQFAEQQFRGHPRRRAGGNGHLLRPELAVSRRTRIRRDLCPCCRAGARGPSRSRRFTPFTGARPPRSRPSLRI